MALSVGEQARWWTVGLVVAAAFLWVLSDILLPFLAGAALAYFLDPVADRLEARGLPRSAATAVVTLVMGGLFLAALLVLIPAAINQAVALIERLPAYAIALRTYVETIAPEQFEPGAPLAQAAESLRARAEEWSIAALRGAWTGGVAIIQIVMLLVVTPVVAFYLLLDWDRLIATLDGWIPRDHVGTVRRLAREVDAALAGFVRGQTTVCLILGTFYATALMAVGLDFGLAIGMFAGLVSFIPYVGTILGAVASVGVALFQFWDEPTMILIVFGIFAVGQLVEGNYLTPRLVGRSVGLHPVTLLFALTAFGSLLGFVGLLVAVPTAAAIGVLGRFAVERYLQGRLYRGLDWAEERERHVEAMAAAEHAPAPEPAAAAEHAPTPEPAAAPEPAPAPEPGPSSAPTSAETGARGREG